ncbi:GNAT family N-acetyltransferase [Vreelandella titanicae]
MVSTFTDNGMMGTCTVNMCANLNWSGRPHAIIENVIVSKDHRKQRIGKANLRCAIDFAQQAGCYKAALMTRSKDPATQVLRVFRIQPKQAEVSGRVQCITPHPMRTHGFAINTGKRKFWDRRET